MARRFTEAGGAGYSVTQCSRVTRSSSAAWPSAVLSAASKSVRLVGVPLWVSAERQGVRVTLQEWDGMCHAFHGFSMFILEATRAFHEIGAWVNSQQQWPRAGLLQRSAPRLHRLFAPA